MLLNLMCAPPDPILPGLQRCIVVFLHQHIKLWWLIVYIIVIVVIVIIVSLIIIVGVIIAAWDVVRWLWLLIARGVVSVVGRTVVIIVWFSVICCGCVWSCGQLISGYAGASLRLYHVSKMQRSSCGSRINAQSANALSEVVNIHGVRLGHCTHKRTLEHFKLRIARGKRCTAEQNAWSDTT